jgi:hypothetical protein
MSASIKSSAYYPLLFLLISHFNFQTSLRERGASVASSAIFYDAKDIDTIQDENNYQQNADQIYQVIPDIKRKASNTSQSSHNDTYDDAEALRRSRKKGPPPAPPMKNKVLSIGKLHGTYDLSKAKRNVKSE